MSRRASVERIFKLVNPSVSAPGTELLPPQSGCLYAPKSTIVCAQSGDVEIDLMSNGDSFLHLLVPASTCEPIEFPDGLELPIGSGVEIGVTANTASITLFYTKYDENPGITKVASRAASYNNVQTTRTPNSFGNDAKT